MDVMRPPLIRIGNRCYRKNPILARDGVNPEDEEDTDYDTAAAAACYNDEACDANIDLEEYTGGFRTRFDVPSVYFKYIIGKRGETKKRLETETRTQIRIPKMGEEGQIVIQGHEKKAVISAKTRIDVMVDSARQKQPFTHFLSVPIQGEEICEKFEDFKFAVMDDDARDDAVDATIFQNTQKLHLTIGTLVLLSEAEIQRARDLLTACYNDLADPLLQGNPLFVDIQGLEYMNDDPGAVDILYAKIQSGPEADKLQILADRLVDRFVDARLMQRQYERVKLHITVMNTLFRREATGVASPSRTSQPRGERERESFDARAILQKFGNFDFGSYNIDRVELSQRFSTSRSGYYESSGWMMLP